MANENKTLSKREKRRLFWTKVLCGILAFMMVAGIAYTSIFFLFN